MAADHLEIFNGTVFGDQRVEPYDALNPCLLGQLWINGFRLAYQLGGLYAADADAWRQLS